MKNNLKNLFSEEVQKILTEESLTAIEQAFDEKVKLSVESALMEQDEVYSEKLKDLIARLDVDRARKLKRIVEALDKSNAAKMVKLVKLYQREEDAHVTAFKKQLVESMSAYLDEYLKETVNPDDLSQAVKNKSAFKVLSNLRNVLAVDSVMMKESVQEAVIDGKKQIDKLQKENAELKKQFKDLYELNQRNEVNVLLESKVSKFSEAKKTFIKRALADKSPKFIEENFDYTVRLFDKQEKDKLKTLKEEAINKRQVKPDFVAPTKTEKVVQENVNNPTLTTEYLKVLSRGKGEK